MTKELTQEERLDLTDIREETEAYHRKFLDYCEVFELDPEKVMQEYFHDIAINSDEYKKLKTENERLKEQLKDYEKILKEYADSSNWFVCYLRHHFIFKKDNYKANELAKETLKKWEKENG